MSNAELITAFKVADVVSHEPIAPHAGEASPYYVDVKRAYGDPRLLKLVAKALAGTLDSQTQFIAASGYGGIPLGTAVSLETGLPFSMVRDSEKNHGKRGFVDGHTPSPGERAAVVDDVFTTGSSIHETAQVLEGLGAEVVYCGVVVARGDPTQFNRPITHLLAPSDLI